MQRSEQPQAATRASVPARRRLRFTRRGVASVLAMMFMVLFSSLAVAMAIVSQGNLRTAETHLQVMRAMGGAETGLVIAQRRLEDAASRFVVERGAIDSGFAERLWSGSLSGGSLASGGDGDVNVSPPPSGHSEGAPPAGIMQALRNAFAAELNVIPLADAPSAPTIHSAPVDADLAIFASANWITTPVYAVGTDGSSTTEFSNGYQVTYAPLADGVTIRTIVTGYSSINANGSGFQYDYDGTSFRPVTRVVQRDFQIAKIHEHAMLSPSRIMIGKNVQIKGNLAAGYRDVGQNNGHPIVMRSDFRGIDPTLDQKLEAFYDGIISSDQDGDNRLRPDHAVEGAGIPVDDDFDGDGSLDGAFQDVTQDGYIDEFDIFVGHYDSNGDGRLVLSAALTAGTPAAGLSPEFTSDEDMALLIDGSTPDRNGNGQSGYADANDNGRWDSGEVIVDWDATNSVHPDVALGWRDGVIDKLDRYKKVDGRLVFEVAESVWSAEQGDYEQFLQGVVDSETEIPVEFGADIPGIDNSTFTNTETPLKALADGLSFEQQVAAQLGVSAAALPAYTEISSDATAPRYFRADLDDTYVFGLTGRHLHEKMPFNSPSFVDWYVRARYENMVFRDVEIPRGNNGLFINCTFVGATYVRTETVNIHPNWTLYGKMEWDADLGRPDYITDPLDKSDFLRYTTGNITDGPENYDDFPSPPIIDGSTKLGDDRNTKLYSNNLRFHDCLFLGSIVSDTSQEYTHVRNKIQFTGSTRFLREHPTEPENPTYTLDTSAIPEFEKSSMMLPNYSVDIGQFNSPTDTHPDAGRAQDVRLQGTIVAGVLDVRGNTSIDGTLMLTFAPVAGEGPLQQNGQAVGNPAGFNASLGYFGPDDGDDESLDPELLPIVDGERIVGWDLDGDGLPDLGPTDTPTEDEITMGARVVPFYGYGRIRLNWNPDLPMPDGIMLPLSTRVVEASYQEGNRGY